MEMPAIQRPTPRRPFDLATPRDTSKPPSPEPENVNPDLLASQHPERSPPPSRTRSILNLTSSTLLGIYAGTTESGREELNTPWGTGAQTPSSERRSIDYGKLDALSSAWQGSQPRPVMAKKRQQTGFRRYYLPLAIQTMMLFGFGMGFGLLATQLQKTQRIAAIPMPTDKLTSRYVSAVWGLLGIAIGNALPYIDQALTDDDAISETSATIQPKYDRLRTLSHSSRGEHERVALVDGGTGPLWHSAVRSAGAFVGIAFALRRVPWQSTLQVAMTLAVANPVLWYLIDRSKTGFAVSMSVGVIGTFLSLVFNPDFVPMPEIHQEQVSDKVGVYVWLGSILFCFSLCFGAIGRRLLL